MINYLMSASSKGLVSQKAPRFKNINDSLFRKKIIHFTFPTETSTPWGKHSYTSIAPPPATFLRLCRILTGPARGDRKPPLLRIARVGDSQHFPVFARRKELRNNSTLAILKRFRSFIVTKFIILPSLP